MKGQKLKAPVRAPAGKVTVPPSKLAPKLSVPKRHGSLVAKGQRSPSEEGTSGRRETEIHRTGPKGEVNILRLDGGDTMVLEKGDMMRLYDNDGVAHAEILRLDTAVARSDIKDKGSPVKLGDLGPLTVTGKGIVGSSRVIEYQPDIMRIHTSGNGENVLWMQGANGGTPFLLAGCGGTPDEVELSSEAGPSMGREGIEGVQGDVRYEGGGATPDTAEKDEESRLGKLAGLSLGAAGGDTVPG